MMRRKSLYLAPKLALPLDAITHTFGIFGQKGSGKSSTSALFVEQGVAAGGRFVVADPTGVWWGLMHDGVGPGLPGIVFGGEHADVPLEKTAGHVVAEFVVQQYEYPVVVLDMKLLRKADRTSFMLGFMETLYHDNREALHVVLDESWQFAPMKAMEGGETIKLLGAVEDVVALGRARGLGITMISQRMATLNANVREQVGTLIAHRLVGALDRKALKGWIEAQADPAREKEVMEVQAKLKTAEALVWSPAFLDYFGVVKMNAPQTFDSRATPKVGQRVKKPGKRAPVDLNVLREKMAATIEEHEANDPKKLKAKLARAESEADSAHRAYNDLVDRWADVQHMSGPTAVEEVLAVYMAARAESGFSADVVDEVRALEARTTEIEVPVMTGNDLLEATTLVNRATDVVKELAGALHPIAEGINKIVADPEKRGPVIRAEPPPAVSPRPSSTSRRQSEPTRSEARPRASAARPVPEAVRDAKDASGGGSNNGQVTNPQQRVLDAIAWYEAIGIGAPTRTQVGAMARYSHISGGFKNLLSACRTAGWITYPSDGAVAFTPEGRALADPPRLPPTTEALHEKLMSLLTSPQQRVLAPVLAAYPKEISREEIGGLSGYSYVSGGFKNLLSSLRTRGIVDYPQDGWVVALDWLFPTGRGHQRLLP